MSYYRTQPGRAYYTGPRRPYRGQSIGGVVVPAMVDTSTVAWQSFAKADPVRSAWLLDRAPRFEFAASVGNSVARFGNLTPNQSAAIDRMMARDAERSTATAVPAAVAPLDVTKVIAAFDAARASGLRRIKLEIAGFVFKAAPMTGRNPGAIYVTKSDEYLGKIANGTFTASRACGTAEMAAIIDIAQDPAAAARTHGLQTGNCSCCSRFLTDPVSVARGIGPICEQRFGWTR